MSSIILISNVNLGLDLLGAIVFLIVSWLFFEAYILKKDIFSLGRALGFLGLSFSEVLRASGGESALFWSIVSGLTLLSGLTVLSAYWKERLPPKPGMMNLAVVPVALSFSTFATWAIPVVFGLIAFRLLRRYYVDIDKLIKWLAISFSLFALQSILGVFKEELVLNWVWAAEYSLRLAAILAMALWIWRFISLRLREEALIVFVSVSMCMALLITTIFSSVILRNIQRGIESRLATSATALYFSLDSTRSKALAAAQIMATNEDFVSAVAARDAGDIRNIGEELAESTGQQFFAVTSRNGEVFFKTKFPILSGENILSERIGQSALEGNPAASIVRKESEGFSVQAAAPLFRKGAIIGAVVTGIMLDSQFAGDFKKVSGFETTFIADDKVVASSALPPGKAALLRRTEAFVGEANFDNQLVIGVFSPVLDSENINLGALALTTTPGELLRSSQSTNRLTVALVFLLAIGFVIPLYRFTVFLTT